MWSVVLSLSCIDEVQMYCFPEQLFPHYWDPETGDNDCLKGKGHTNQVTKMAVNDEGELVTCSMDDTLRFTRLDNKEYR